MDQTTDQHKKMMELRFDYQDAMRNPKTTPQLPAWLTGIRRGKPDFPASESPV